MKLELELTKEQFQLIINSVELYARFLMGQPYLAADILTSSYLLPKKETMSQKQWSDTFNTWLLHKKSAEYALGTVTGILNLMRNSDKFPDDAHRLSDMWSALRHAQYEVSATKDELDVRSCEPMQLSDLPMIKARVVEK